MGTKQIRMGFDQLMMFLNFIVYAQKPLIKNQWRATTSQILIICLKLDLSSSPGSDNQYLHGRICAHFRPWKDVLSYVRGRTYDYLCPRPNRLLVSVAPLTYLRSRPQVHMRSDRKLIERDKICSWKTRVLTNAPTRKEVNSETLCLRLK